MENYLTVKDVAIIVKLSTQTIRRYVHNREIPFHKIYRAVRFKPSEITQWLIDREKAHAKNLSPNLFNGTGNTTPTGADV
jgi:excisionase family DNA binding protein